MVFYDLRVLFVVCTMVEWLGPAFEISFSRQWTIYIQENIIDVYRTYAFGILSFYSLYIFYILTTLTECLLVVVYPVHCVRKSIYFDKISKSEKLLEVINAKIAWLINWHLNSNHCFDVFNFTNNRSKVDTFHINSSC